MIDGCVDFDMTLHNDAFSLILSIAVGTFITRKKFLDDFFKEMIKSCTHAEDER